MPSVLQASSGGGCGCLKKEEKDCMEGRCPGFISELCLEN